MAFDEIQIAGGLTDADILAHTDTKERELFLSLATGNVFAALADGATPVAIGSGDSAGLIQVGTAWVGGDQSGDTRGTGALDVQSRHILPSQVASGFYSAVSGSNNTASGVYSAGFGINNTASGDGSAAFGINNTASGISSSAFGFSNIASGDNSSAFGFNNATSGDNSSAFGRSVTTSGDNSSAFGRSVTTTVDDTFEAGFWSSSNTRGGASRADSSGLFQTTFRDDIALPIDGGAVAGSEPVGTLGRGMMTIQMNGNVATLVVNDAGGTVRSLALGSVA